MAAKSSLPQTGRMMTAAAGGKIEVIKNLITANEALIRAVDDGPDALYPGFTGARAPPASIVCVVFVFFCKDCIVLLQTLPVPVLGRYTAMCGSRW
jgi:hypothetical protein